jgi:two-component system sensor histidine kinase HydH
LNAVQAMEQGGTLKVEAFQKNGCAVLRVSDTGSGIPPDHLTHIFDPYFTTKAQGVGLGLANVHKFIEAHGGEIQVESTPGEGTSFIIHLPLNGQANLENALP